MGTLPGDTDLIVHTQKFSVLHFFSSSTGLEKQARSRTKQRKTDVDKEEEREFQDLPGNS